MIASQARRRLFLISAHDSAGRPLTDKLLARPRLLSQIRALIPDRERAHLVPYNTTELERELALALDIPMYGADPRFFPLGSKSGCRQLFADEGVQHPLGVEHVRTVPDVVDAIIAMRVTRPGLKQVLVKHNDGVSGEGNSIVDLAGLPAPGDPTEPDAIELAVRAMAMEAPESGLDAYLAVLDRHAGIVEERIVGDEIRSPSVQLRVTPLGELEVLSTHDQLLGGPSGQSYLGCKFPADPAYAALITREAVIVGNRLAKEGVIGRFAIDFVAVRDGSTGEWDAFAIELNLRKGGTTHPFLTLQFLTDGSYDDENAIFKAPAGQAKYFVASDHVESPTLRGLAPDDLFDIIVNNGLHFDQARQTGVVFHMISALSHLGKVGLTAVDDSPEAAHALYERACALVLAAAEGSYTAV